MAEIALWAFSIERQKIVAISLKTKNKGETKKGCNLKFSHFRILRFRAATFIVKIKLKMW